MTTTTLPSGVTVTTEASAKTTKGSKPASSAKSSTAPAKAPKAEAKAQAPAPVAAAPVEAVAQAPEAAPAPVSGPPAPLSSSKNTKSSKRAVIASLNEREAAKAKCSADMNEARLSLQSTFFLANDPKSAKTLNDQIEKAQNIFDTYPAGAGRRGRAQDFLASILIASRAHLGRVWAEAPILKTSPDYLAL